MLRSLAVTLGALVVLAHCGSDSDHAGGGANGSGAAAGHAANGGSGGVAPGPSDSCGSVRLTAYTASATGFCEWDRTQSLLPSFVQQGLTLAIAEPYDGSSYGGDPGEACGECWEIDTITDTRIVMVHDLCPIQGNPLCAGGHFHFDLATEAAAALHGGGLDEASARRVPCPVSGNVFAQINDRNEFGYVRLAFINHRIPIRSAEYHAVGDTTWRAVQRSGGAFHVLDDNATFASAGPGGVFRITSAQGEVLELPNVLDYGVTTGTSFDLGAQLSDQNPSQGSACVFEPPSQIYGDGYGGIDQVRWAANPWGSATASETSDGCYGGGGSCIRIDALEQWSGFHLYYRQPFPTATFARVALRVRALSGSGSLNVAPSLDGTRCAAQTAGVGAEWSELTIDLAQSCAAQPELNALTVDNPGAPLVLLVDDVRFLH